MKRTLLDITHKISRNPKRVVLIPKNLTDATYWIYEATGWKFVNILREIEKPYIERRNQVEDITWENHTSRLVDIFKKVKK